MNKKLVNEVKILVRTKLENMNLAFIPRHVINVSTKGCHVRVNIRLNEKLGVTDTGV